MRSSFHYQSWFGFNSLQVVKRKESSYLETKVTLNAAIKRAETGFPWKGIWHALIDIASTDVYNYECRSGAAHRLQFVNAIKRKVLINAFWCK